MIKKNFTKILYYKKMKKHLQQVYKYMLNTIYKKITQK